MCMAALLMEVGNTLQIFGEVFLKMFAAFDF